MKSCIFCPNPRTQKRGEHVWDDWVNRSDGRALRRRATVGELGKHGALIREYPVQEVNVTKPVVCDCCNNGWMSDLTSHAKLTIEGFQRHERPATLLPLGILTVSAFMFMKSAVLDYSAEKTRPPFISPIICHRFRSVMRGVGSIHLPEGVQIWMARYRGERKEEYRFWIDSMALTFGPYRGFDILVITYVAQAFVLQLTFPRWRKRKQPTVLPVFTQADVWDVASVPIWPDVHHATWPPLKYLNGAALQDFRHRLETVQFR